MGGNVTFGDAKADAIEICSDSTHANFKSLIACIQKKINDEFVKINGSHLWRPENLGKVYAGSTRFIFDSNIPTLDLVRFKRYFGDIDCQVDKTLLWEITQCLRSLLNKDSDITLIGWKQSVDTIVTLWRHKSSGANYQMDLELVDFVDGLPTEWAQFSRSSSWLDMQNDIKGFAHKYIFRAITAIWLQETNIQKKTKTVTQKISRIVFSPKGARIKYRQLEENLWEEIPMAESYLINDVDQLGLLFFPTADSHKILEQMQSFVGVVHLIKQYIDKSKYERICEGMFHLLWGPGAQRMSKDKITHDLLIKAKAYEYMTKELLGKELPVIERVQEYYQLPT